MAQKHVTIYIDDLTGQETEEGSTHTFALNGVQYEIDLSPDSYDQLLEALGPFLKSGRRMRGKARRPASPRQHLEGPPTAEIREWARQNGFEVNERGRVPAEVREAYEAAH
ncbi:Lsr2 family protein [Streptomyces sp. NPDC056069]|uniref:histone-like nucleoid-structuring protein Lsr2 n=1 Tax=Streptomyces sp. NPDC056069 TaxID=3345702 RepID=UPI0035D958A3